MSHPVFHFSLSAKRDQLQVLQTYKDKEYPAKALKIAELQKEIDLFNIANREDKSELEVSLIWKSMMMDELTLYNEQSISIDLIRQFTIL